MKTDWAKNLSALMADVPQREYSDDAVTTGEMASEYNLSQVTCGRIARANVLSGKWRQVWKRVNGKPAQAYLPVKK